MDAVANTIAKPRVDFAHRDPRNHPWPLSKAFLFYQGVVRNSLAWVSQSTSSQRNNVLPLEITRGKRWLDGTIVGRIYTMDDELVFKREDQFEDTINFLLEILWNFRVKRIGKRDSENIWMFCQLSFIVRWKKVRTNIKE